AVALAALVDRPPDEALEGVDRRRRRRQVFLNGFVGEQLEQHRRVGRAHLAQFDNRAGESGDLVLPRRGHGANCSESGEPGQRDACAPAPTHMPDAARAAASHANPTAAMRTALTRCHLRSSRSRSATAPSPPATNSFRLTARTAYAVATAADSAPAAVAASHGRRSRSDQPLTSAATVAPATRGIAGR